MAKLKQIYLSPGLLDMIPKRLYPDLKKLEMYARNTRQGWDCFGNEVID